MELRLCRELGIASREDLYAKTTPQQREEWFFYLAEELPLPILIDCHFAQLAAILATANNSKGKAYSPEQFRLIKPPTKPKTAEDIAAALTNFVKTRELGGKTTK